MQAESRSMTSWNKPASRLLQDRGIVPVTRAVISGQQRHPVSLHPHQNGTVAVHLNRQPC